MVLIPWRDGGDDRRAQLWDWARWWLARELDWPIFTGAGPDGDFSRSAAINEAAERADSWDVALIGDADTVQPRDPAERGAALASLHGLCVPWTHRVKLSRAGTDRLVRRGPDAVTDADRDKRDVTSAHGGGATVCVSREAFDFVGGFDPRFVGYGNEDLAFRAAVETLVVRNGAPRAHGIVWHLWHEAAPRVGTRGAATRPNQELWRRYAGARWNERAMAELVA